jgi:pre-rRNA-processing protein IPI3
MGHSADNTNICVSASKDNTVIVWNYHTGDLLRTFLLPSTPLCLALDPCDRGVYVGFDDGSLQLIEFIQTSSAINPLYNTSLQNTPVQITLSPWTVPSDAEPSAAHCLSISYDGTYLISGHASGKVLLWDVGSRSFSKEIADLNSPVTNLLMLSPFPAKMMTKASTVVKPKLAEGNYTFTAQLTGKPGNNSFNRAMATSGFPSDILQDAISRLSNPTVTSSSGDDKLRKENEELWRVVNEQRALQKRTMEKYNKLKAGGG